MILYDSVCPYVTMFVYMLWLFVDRYINSPIYLYRIDSCWTYYFAYWCPYLKIALNTYIPYEKIEPLKNVEDWESFKQNFRNHFFKHYSFVFYKSTKFCTRSKFESPKLHKSTKKASKFWFLKHQPNILPAPESSARDIDSMLGRSFLLSTVLMRSKEWTPL